MLVAAARRLIAIVLEAAWMAGERDGTRTHDHLIKSQVLYQLSYALARGCVRVATGPVNSREN
jgi:hypothetical protein